jgi:hypothetical protein
VIVKLIINNFFCMACTGTTKLENYNEDKFFILFMFKNSLEITQKNGKKIYARYVVTNILILNILIILNIRHFIMIIN